MKIVECLSCGEPFHQTRPNRKHCSANCRKKASRNTARGDRTVEKRRRRETHYDRARALQETVYKTVPEQRLGIMREILQHAASDAQLRAILTDRKLLGASRRFAGQLNIAMAGNAYTRKFLGISIEEFINQQKLGTLPSNHPVQQKRLV